MRAVTNPNDLLALDRFVALRADLHEPLANAAIAEFGSHASACKAVHIVRRDDWLVQGELWLDDEDFLTLQVLHRRLQKRVASEKSSSPNRFFRDGQNDKTGGAKSVSEVTLGDLL